MNKTYITVFGGLFFIMLFMIGTWTMARGMATGDWLPASGTVTESEIRRSHSSKRSHQHIIVRHSVDGKEFSAQMELTDVNLERKYTDRFPVGAPAEIFYDPQDPARASFHRGATWRDAIPLIMALGMLAGIILLRRHIDRKVRGPDRKAA